MDVGGWEAAPTLQGQAASIAIVGSQLSIDGAQITRPDIMPRNGVIHGIDKVNIPEPPPR
ncbi:fasciclin domain-containing protein [Pseudoxanthomonas sp. PXM01]|nr:fasciclin domain-containing protein [Pseudoxanthomonas sp. PXM01]